MRDLGGKLEDKAALQRALTAANFPSVRGKFRFNTNHMPIQSFYLREVVKEDGKVQNRMRGTIFTDYADGFAKDCHMQ